MSRVLLCAFGAMVIGVAPAMGQGQGQGRLAAEIAKEIGSTTLPEPDAARANDAPYLREFKAARSALRLRKAELIAELYRADPKHPSLAEWMPMRWWWLSGRLDSPDVNDGARDLIGEIDGVLAAAGSTPALKQEAARVKAWILGSPFGDFGASRGYEAQARAVDSYIAAYPKDPRAADLLWGFVIAYPKELDRVDALCRRIVRDYPESVEARRARKRIARREAEGKPFELTFRDAIGGAEVSTRDLRGKIIVVDFWATWCAPCVAELPRLKELHARYAGKDVAFLGVSLDLPEAEGGLDKLRKFAAKTGLPWPQYYPAGDPGSEFTSKWGISSIPALFVIGRDGKVVSADARAKLEPLILELLARDPASSAAAPAGR